MNEYVQRNRVEPDTSKPKVCEKCNWYNQGETHVFCDCPCQHDLHRIKNNVVVNAYLSDTEVIEFLYYKAMKHDHEDQIRGKYDINLNSHVWTYGILKGIKERRK